ncbi:MAG: hypothetical protein V7733_09945, partial [Paraglaciecola polaris]|uniref:hypothetical protein n=1 Tax=Paraglaciecola polaris TaxID=222814 RepID=UPI0030026699
LSASCLLAAGQLRLSVANSQLIILRTAVVGVMYFNALNIGEIVSVLAQSASEKLSQASLLAEQHWLVIKLLHKY